MNNRNFQLVYFASQSVQSVSHVHLHTAFRYTSAEYIFRYVLIPWSILIETQALLVSQIHTRFQLKNIKIVSRYNRKEVLSSNPCPFRFHKLKESHNTICESTDASVLLGTLLLTVQSTCAWTQIGTIGRHIFRAVHLHDQDPHPDSLHQRLRELGILYHKLPS